MKTQEVLAYIESGEDTAYGMFADLDPKIKKAIRNKVWNLQLVKVDIYMVSSVEISLYK